MSAATTASSAAADATTPAVTVLSRARWWGLVGTTLLAVGALGAGVLPRPDPLADTPILRLLRDGAGVPICIGVAALGMAIWVVAWWSLRAHSAQLRARWLAVTAAVWSLPLLLAPPLLSRDVYSYAAQGQVAAQGRNPYEYGPAEITSDWTESTSPSWYFSHAPYGPLFVIVARGAAMLGEATGRIEVAVLALRLVSVAAVAVTAVYLPRLARHCGVSAGPAQWLAIGSPLLLVHSVSGAHNDVVMLALIVVGLVYLAEHRQLLGGVALGAAVAVKAPALLVLPFAVLLAAALVDRDRRWQAVALRRAGTMVAAVVASLAAFTVIAGFGWGWIGALSVPGASVQWTSLPTSWGIAASWFTGPFAIPADDNPVLVMARGIGTGLLALVLVGIWIQTARAVLRGTRTARTVETPAGRHDTTAQITRRLVQACGLALLALIVLAPAFHPWYFLWPLVLLAASVTSNAGRTALAATAAALCFLVLPDGYNLARATAAIGVPLAVLFTAYVPAWWWRTHGRRAPEQRTASVPGYSANA